MRAADGETVGPVEIDVDVLTAVARLSIQQRAAVYLTYWADLPPSEVAGRMGISEGSVKKQLARARRRLGEWLS
jgi:RNA polymerase sigma factor (sigma-70 family)